MTTTIAISGIPGSGSSTVAKLLAKKLAFNYFSPGQLFKDLSTGVAKQKPYFSEFEKICKTKNLQIPDFASGDDTNSLINLWDTEFGKSKDLHNSIDELQVSLSNLGRYVIDGKLSLRMLENAKLKIWLTCSLDARIKRTSGRDKIPSEGTKNLLQRREQQERKEWQKIYGFDYWNQEKDAHLTMDTTHSSPKQIVEKVVKFLQD